MADCLPSPFKEIGKCIQCVWPCLWPFLEPHFNYWWCFDDNIQGLIDQVQKLDQQISDLKARIDATRLRVEVVKPGVETWLKASTEKLEEARRILPGDNIPKACNLFARYSLGKNANETAEEIAKLRNDGDFNPIADPAPPAAEGFTSHRSTMDFESRKHIEEAIIDSLKQKSVAMIGICGMGGVGKTTMAERIGEKVKVENLFDEVVKVTVSQKIEMPKIQSEIADLLKLKFDETSDSARAHQLHTRLMDEKRKIIIFDDVWGNLKLDKLGVPSYERCKIILTTRYTDVCQKMEAQEIIEMEILAEEDAWILFKQKAGPCVEGSTLQRVAKKVAAECKGLPLALVTVGLSLRDKRDVHTWEDSLKKLKEPNRANFREVEDEVYKPLKLSYDYLEDDQQYLFLLCCLFPEDYDIRVEQLIWHIMGLQLFWHSMELPLFDDINNIKEARDRTHNLVEKLKSRFLLIDGRDELHVRMHDVVRDVAIYIGSKEKKGFLKSLTTSIKNSSDVNCNWMSVEISNERMKVPVLSQFPRLRLLLLSFNEFDDTSDNDIYYVSFEGMEDLNVLSFRRSSIGSLPTSLGSIKNLQTLCLVDCVVENISVIGELTSLKIFSCYRCRNIRELPEEIQRLKDLTLLELTECRELQRIPFGVISKFVWLEELKILRSFSEWEAEENGKERRNASLKELECLLNLCCLEIEIDDCTLSAQEIRLSQNLVKYYIRIGSYNKYHYYFNERDYVKVMILNLPSDIGAVGKWIQKRVRNTEFLHLEGDGCGSNNFNIAEIEYLRNLRVRKCSTVKKLDMVLCSLDTLILDEVENLEEICIIPNQNVSLCNLKSIEIKNCDKLRSLFSVSVARRWLLQLEVLDIRYCESMEEVFWNEENTNECVEFPMLKNLRLASLPKLNSLSLLMDVSFANLKSIYISKCYKLRSLFSVSVAKTSLLQLEVLEIKYCDAMEEVFWNEGTDDNKDGCFEFPKLKELKLRYLQNMTAFWQGLENKSIKFPNLTKMRIVGLAKLNILFPTKDVSFANLKSIYISQCYKLRSLFSVSGARRCLLQLEVLSISSCDAMEQVFWNEGTDDNTDGCIEFSKLKELTLKDLPNLTTFCQGLENKSIKFPNLTTMDIGGLPSLKNSVFPLSSEIPAISNP